ncbi:uncharacterized protein LOC127843023 isoform X1 [Dreissena polymorpha]|uniref:uncharacterized protein LOC127843023 isoform X1 n=1 Tax=Dreissena polymorpha TaxID=45954 RepID=UPI0022643558|nr:uncharacterized protein LOC127843023 isoform X1 [Dreissena polymorpha]
MKPKPTQVKARYLEQKPPTEKLPPIQTPQEGSQLEEAVKYELTSKQSRELKLFQAGDMQGKIGSPVRVPYTGPLQYRIVTVYNFRQELVAGGRDMPDRDAVQAHVQLFKHHPLLRGYTSILAFDPDSKSFQWRAQGGTGSSTEVDKVDNRPTSGRCRPFTAGPDRSSISAKQPVSPFQYQKLVAFGFRPVPSVQYLIQTQLGVPVRSTQFDPLDIRSAQPGVNTRWVVELCTTADMTKAIQSGLQAGTCKLVFYPHDDITRRETAAYINYMEVVNAHAQVGLP